MTFTILFGQERVVEGDGAKISRAQMMYRWQVVKKWRKRNSDPDFALSQLVNHILQIE